MKQTGMSAKSCPAGCVPRPQRERPWLGGKHIPKGRRKILASGATSARPLAPMIDDAAIQNDFDLIRRQIMSGLNCSSGAGERDGPAAAEATTQLGDL